MSIEELKEKMKKVQSVLLDFLEDELNAEENYENFVKMITDFQINEGKQEIKSILRLINVIGNNHQRIHNFINKIMQILVYFKEKICKYFTNSEIFEVFNDNKRILLFLIEEKIMRIDECIVSRITSNEYLRSQYCEYFAPEIKPFLTDEFLQKYRNKNSNLNKIEFI
ncbi:hypothetical protein M9Y10_003729 [Tritrichomonas musculus]|uniref:Uncharacterized protein n=1 Tax=Tritrichomonas musculus TaxID=1915356 RepID=A0ABR2JQQ5_9EUKA